MSERDYDMKIAVGPEKQSAYGTALVDGSLDTFYPMNGVAFLEEDPGFVPNDDQVGIGEWPTDQNQEMKDCRMSLGYDCGTWMLGWVTAFGLGNSTPALLDTTAYSHTNIPITASKQLPVTTIAVQPTAGIKRKVRDIAVARFKISGEGKQRLKLEFDLIGSGHVASSALSFPTISADSFLRTHGVTFEIGASGSEVDDSDRLKKWSFEWDNHPLEDDGYYPGSGQVRGRLEHGRRTGTLEFDLLLDANTTELDHLEANDALKAIITAQGALIESTYYHKLVLTLPKLKYKALPMGSEDNMVLYNVKSNLLYDSGVGYLVQAVVNNLCTGFLTAEA